MKSQDKKNQDKFMFNEAIKQAQGLQKDSKEVVEVEAMTSESVQQQAKLNEIMKTLPDQKPLYSHALLLSLKENLGFYTDHLVIEIDNFKFTLKPLNQENLGAILKFLRFYFGVFKIQTMTNEQLLRFRPYIIGYALSHINNIPVEILFNEGNASNEILKGIALKNVIVDFFLKTLKSEYIIKIYQAYLEKWSYTLQIIKNKLYQCPLCGWEIAITKDERIPKVCTMDSYELVEVQTDPLV